MGISCSMSIIAHPGQKRIEILRQFERRRVNSRKNICLSWNFEAKSALWIYGRPYNIPGVEPLENKLLWISADIMHSSFSFLKKLVTLATILRVYFFCDLLLWIYVQDFLVLCTVIVTHFVCCRFLLELYLHHFLRNSNII